MWYKKEPHLVARQETSTAILSVYIKCDRFMICMSIITTLTNTQ